jgi:hypothetical protein
MDAHDNPMERLRAVLDEEYRTPTELADLAGLTLATVGGCLAACSRTGEVERKWDGQHSYWRKVTG